MRFLILLSLKQCDKVESLLIEALIFLFYFILFFLGGTVYHM